MVDVGLYVADAALVVHRSLVMAAHKRLNKVYMRWSSCSSEVLLFKCPTAIDSVHSLIQLYRHSRKLGF